MMKRLMRRLASDKRGAVAPTVALSLVALIACGGLAFDYAHMAALDTELQQAADQAALAAASQLDGQSGACARAAAAAHNLVVNSAKFASGSGSQVVDVPTQSDCAASANLTFYKDYNQTTDTPGTALAATDFANAKFVVLTVVAKTANYALTPIVNLFNSGAMSAQAVATLGSAAICKVPPLMMCNPNEGGITPNNTFPLTGDIGKGMKLEAGGGTTWAPGNYGYLAFTNSVEQGMGANSNIDSCLSSDDVKTKPGNVAGAPAGINTRFDIYESGLVAYCAQGNGNCSPAENTMKDVVHAQFTSGTAPNEIAGTGKKPDNCQFKTGTGDPWVLPTPGYVPGGATPTSMGLPRDICHAKSKDGDCGGATVMSRFGDGNWDRALYFNINHGSGSPPSGAADLVAAATWAGKSSTATTGSTALTRYDVYKWELATSGKLGRRFAEAAVTTGSNKHPDLYNYSTARCAPAQAATTTIKDRRLLTAALVNCTAGVVKGSTNITPSGWVDLFVTEPSIDRTGFTGKDQIYVEVVGIATKPDGSNAFQYFYRQKPRLVK